MTAVPARVHVGYNYPAGQKILPAALAAMTTRFPEVSFVLSG